MRVAALYDIHGNLPALEAVLEEVRRASVDVIVIGGDVLPGPMPRETLERLFSLEIPTHFLRGNGDRETTEPTGAVPEQYRENMAWNARQLTSEQRNVVASWPATLRIEIPGLGRVLFCHATPQSDTEIFTELTPAQALEATFAQADASLVVCGHTHMQFDRLIGTTRVVNAGSVGMPFGERGAYWLELGPGVQLRHATYDYERAAQRIRQSSDPHADHFASVNVLNPPTAKAMLGAFTGQSTANESLTR